jgi:hypothetical protein
MWIGSVVLLGAASGDNEKARDWTSNKGFDDGFTILVLALLVVRGRGGAKASACIAEG